MFSYVGKILFVQRHAVDDFFHAQVRAVHSSAGPSDVGDIALLPHVFEPRSVMISTKPPAYDLETRRERNPKNI